MLTLERQMARSGRVIILNANQANTLYHFTPSGMGYGLLKPHNYRVRFGGGGGLNDSAVSDQTERNGVLRNEDQTGS